LYSLIKSLIGIILRILIIPFKYIIKSEDLIIFQSVNNHRYCDNTKYLFEHLSLNSDIKVYWVTDSREIINYLNKHNFNYISMKRNFIKYIYIALKAKIVIDNGISFFNPFNLLSKRVLKVHLGHGNGSKTVQTKKGTLLGWIDESKRYNSFDFINYTSDFLIKEVGINQFDIEKHKLINLGYPRCDNFFDKKIIEECLKKKIMANYICGQKLDNNSKIIYYTPTWRPYKYDIPLFTLIDDFELFDEFLTINNIFIFYSVHQNILPNNIIKSRRVVYIDDKKLHLFDSSALLLESNILLNDYSTTTTEFCLLKRPQIFLIPDYKNYLESKGFLDDYINIIPGPKINTLEKLKAKILIYIEREEVYLKDYESKILNYNNKYYGHKIGNSSDLFNGFINNYLSKTNFR
jgi:CDP-glycerol glycerophosphotransferase (TagB/SpsB family)